MAELKDLIGKYAKRIRPPVGITKKEVEGYMMKPIYVYSEKSYIRADVMKKYSGIATAFVHGFYGNFQKLLDDGWVECDIDGNIK